MVPSAGVRSFMLNTSRPLFRNNVKLRQAINFAIDRRALTRELGSYAGTVSDQFMPPNIPGFRDERIYPLDRPGLPKARSLASGRTRSGRAVLYTLPTPVDVAQAQILRRNLAKIGIALEVKQFPLEVLSRSCRHRASRSTSVGSAGTACSGPRIPRVLFHGRTIGQPDSANWSYFNSPKYNRLLDRALSLPVGPARSRAFGEIDVQIAGTPRLRSRTECPTTSRSSPGRWGVSWSIRTLDLTAVCLK